MSQDYIGGLRLTPDGNMVVAAAADGLASLLEMRKGGARLSSVACGGPLRCAQTDGHLALLGTESGQVTLFDGKVSLSKDKIKLPHSCGGIVWVVLVWELEKLMLIGCIACQHAVIFCAGERQGVNKQMPLLSCR